MSKNLPAYWRGKIIIFGLVVLVLASVVGAVIYNRRERGGQIVSPFSEEAPKALPTVKEEKFKTYKDEAGFFFNYSENLTVQEIPNQDEKTYSTLEIFSASRLEEKMTINVLDTNFSNTEEWLVKNKKPGWVVNEAVISGMNGKLIHAPQQIISVAIDKGIIFIIESSANTQGFWENQQKIIRESFTVQWPEEQKTSGSSQTIELEEEVIE